MDLGALEKNLLEYRCSEGDESGEVDGPPVLMTPSLIMSPTKDAPASLAPVAPVYLALDSQRRDAQKLIHEFPRRRRIDETMRVSFLARCQRRNGRDTKVN